MVSCKFDAFDQFNYKFTMNSSFCILSLGTCFLFASCGTDTTRDSNSDVQVVSEKVEVFTPIPSSTSGVKFNNQLQEDAEQNYFRWEYFYNGGGVAVLDMNNDGLSDLYFTGNMTEDKLYLNKGDLTFEDITASAIPSGQDGWHTGVTHADVNGDGHIDLYVCRSGPDDQIEHRSNLLYLNNGDNTFRESAAELGIDDASPSTQAAFFDYDLDGDLDLYVMNHPAVFHKEYTHAEYLQWMAEGTNISDHLYRNDQGQYVDVTKETGVNNHAYGLGLSIGDFNNDGFPDVYVANDYDEGDYFYINQGDGTFKNEVQERMKHISNFGMGTDAADFNNDGNLDLIEMDMAYEDHVRSKRNMASMSTEKFRTMVRSGNHYQYMSNSLQVNTGNHTFSEIAQLAGVAKTDWSWAPLFADFDLDGQLDLFITNGYRKDAMDRDFQNELEAKLEIEKQLPFEEVIQMVPETQVRNYLFSNNGDLTFSKKNEDWGVVEAFNSNGSAYCDLDNDGDLDLVVNNLDAEASIYRNKASESGRSYLKVRLKYIAGNPNGIGARLKIKTNEGTQMRELHPTRGYLSAVDHSVFFGLESTGTIQELEVIWPNGKKSKILQVKANQTLDIDYTSSQFHNNTSPASTSFFANRSQDFAFRFKHTENSYDDFEKELLLPHMQSRQGPAVAVADVNGDGLDDMYLGGASEQSGALLLQVTQGKFSPTSTVQFEQDRQHEDVGALFFDANGDGSLDLYVVSGGNFVPDGDPLLQDRLYLNDGAGNFTKSEGALPKMPVSGSSVAASDIDADGDLDLFVGGRLRAQAYPSTPNSFLLINDGGQFSDASDQMDMSPLGMVTKSMFVDIDGDRDEDLIAVGEWMDIVCYQNNAGKLELHDITPNQTLAGWWYGLNAADLDGDGDVDFVVGNLGLNHKYKASPEHPFNVYAADFDQSGSLDIVLSKYQGETNYPVRGRECSSEQMPFIQEKFPTYKGFAEADVNAIYGTQELEDALHLEVTEFRSGILWNEGNGIFNFSPFSPNAQISPLFDFQLMDLNQDGNLDIVAVGNLFEAEVETVRHDAGMGLVLLSDGKGNFNVAEGNGGLFVPGNARAISQFSYTTQNIPLLLVMNNDHFMQVFQVVTSK